MLPKFSKGQDSGKGVWRFQDAKAKLSEVLNKVDENGPQIIVRNKKHFLIISEEAYRDYMGVQRSVLDVFLRCPHPDIELDTTRSKETLRDIDL